ncbi:MAG: putative transposase [Acidobacteria bacterium]|nr:putative transposase [Acidobacteriota bacterium]
MTRTSEVGDILTEYDGQSLGDARLDERLRRIVTLAAADPSQSFPDQMESIADREALYRFLANPKVTLPGVLNGHVRQTHDRMRGHGLVRIVHDTSTFRFPGERGGLGVLRGGARGFLGHVALAVAADETREPLGVVGVYPYIHQDAVAHTGMTPCERVKATRAKPRAEKESARWEQMALTVSAELPPDVEALHVMDQEADDYDVLAALDAAGLRYVIRACPRRQTTDAKLPVKEVLARQAGTVFRTVPLTPRSAQKEVKTRGRHPERLERLATLHVRWGTVTIPRRQYSDTRVATLAIHAVHVVEPEPPPGEAAIEWMLVTSEPVQTLEDAAAIVDHYRARWLIEEYFKALKTGCAFEKRQLMHLDGLVRALAVFVPMAWRLLLLRHLGRAPVPIPVDRLFDGEQVLLLRKLLKRRGYPLPRRPTMRDAMLGIAALGGHIKNNGSPGWLVLGRGLTRFVETEVGWRLAREEM